MIQLLRTVFQGLASIFEVTYSPLYRYPYRHSGEAMRGDWLKLGKDVERAFEEPRHYESTKK